MKPGINVFTIFNGTNLANQQIFIPQNCSYRALISTCYLIQTILFPRGPVKTSSPRNLTAIWLEFAFHFASEGQWTILHHLRLTMCLCYRLRWDVDNKCGRFHLSQLPLPYHANAECYWHIKTSAGSTVELSFGDFHLENSINCYYDYLAVRERRIRRFTSQL